MSLVHVSQCGLHGGEDSVETEIHEINSGHGDDDAAVQHNAGIQDVVKDVDLVLNCVRADDAGPEGRE